jgi:glutamyl-tRNA synthetase
MDKVRVRFAPSPTGPLHIGGVRTALYNYLFAKKNNGDFILRIEDTDQTRYVPGAEDYIIESLDWFGFKTDEGPIVGGKFGPYRQSERKALYKQYADRLLNEGNAYYAFDTPEELDGLREDDKTFKYDNKSRLSLKNSLTLSEEEVQGYLDKGEHIAVRLKMPVDQTISFTDEIRGNVSFESNDLDDKVILKGDGMPTYHLANIVDDHLMQITHVIRGEEWLSSTAHHVLIYQFFGWTAPSFAHLPLILKPTGQGKLSKRDGAKFGFPVFPISWKAELEEDNFIGFREDGYMPEAVLNFLALLGWNPGGDEEIFTIKELESLFSLDKIVKSGARFDIDKAKWFNQQYIIHADNDVLAKMITGEAEQKGFNIDLSFLSNVCALMKERVHKASEIIENGSFFFESPSLFDEETIIKKYKKSSGENILKISAKLVSNPSINSDAIETEIKGYIQENGLKMGEIMPIMRIAICGTMQGPDLAKIIHLIGIKEMDSRIQKAINHFNTLIS